jgi:hypothetical protein
MKKVICPHNNNINSKLTKGRTKALHKDIKITIKVKTIIKITKPITKIFLIQLQIKIHMDIQNLRKMQFSL